MTNQPDTCIYTGRSAVQCPSTVTSEIYSPMTRRTHVMNECTSCGEVFFTSRQPTQEEVAHSETRESA